MNGSGKQSYYEIQLNNGSLIAAFLVAVVLGIAVFGLGVMVGRGQGPETLPEGGWVESIGPADSAEDTGEVVDTSFLDELAAPEEPEAGGANDSGANATPQAPVEQPPAAAPPAQVAALPQTDDNIAPGNGWVVQVKATNTRAEAEQLQARLNNDGFRAFLVAAEVSGQMMFRVRVGRFASESDAARVASALSQRSEIDSTWVTKG